MQLSRYLILRKIHTALHLPFREKLWFLLLFLLSGLARAAILSVPFKHLAPYLGIHYQNTQLSSLVSQQQLYLAWRIGRHCELVARYTPWESKCLVQALMAKTLLRMYGIPYVLHFGVAKPTRDTTHERQTNMLKAHAWLKVGPWVITGQEGHRAFTVVATFTSPGITMPCISPQPKA